MNILPILAIGAGLLALTSKRPRDPRAELARLIDATIDPDTLDRLAAAAAFNGFTDLAAAASSKAAAIRSMKAAQGVIETPPTIDPMRPPPAVNTAAPPATDTGAGTVIELPPVEIVGEVPRYFVVRNGDGGAYQIAGTFFGDSSRWRELRDAQPSAKRRAEISAGKMNPNWRLKVPDSLLPAYNSDATRPLETYTQAVAVDGQVAEAGA